MEPRATKDIPTAPRGWKVPTESRWEGKAGVLSLQEIQHERAAISARHEQLWSRYGAGGTFDAQRKSYRSAIMLELMIGEAPGGKKAWTDTLLEAAASADPRYRAWLDNAEMERAELQALTVQMTHFDEAYNRGQAELRTAQAEWQHSGSQV